MRWCFVTLLLLSVANLGAAQALPGAAIDLNIGLGYGFGGTHFVDRGLVVATLTGIGPCDATDTGRSWQASMRLSISCGVPLIVSKNPAVG